MATRTDRAVRSWAKGVHHGVRTLRWRAVVSGAMLLGVAGCQGVLDVTNPTIVQDKDIANPAGAYARLVDVYVHFHPVALSLANDVALFTDERVVDLPITRNDVSYYLDRRDGDGYQSLYAAGQFNDPHLGGWDDIVFRTSVAIPQLRLYAPDSAKGDYLAEMYAYRGYSILQIAEDICPGFPINDVSDNIPVFSAPYTTDSAVKYAIVELDSVMAEAHDSVDLVNFAKVLKGRALLDLGQYAQAAAAVTSVPSDFSYQTPPTLGGYGYNYFPSPNNWNPSNRNAVRFAVGDTEGTNGLPFVSAHDPRVTTVYRLQRLNNPADSLYDQTKYTSVTTPMVLASGLEARLIEAEAALNAGDPSWFTTLNTLRATMIAPAMDPIPVMPATTAAQVDLLYRERAFWLYLTGRRLGDLRRMIRNYGRDPETLFPKGLYSSRGSSYATATAIPFVQAVQGFYNSQITGCTTP